MSSKFAAISNGTAKVSRMIVAQLQSYSALQQELEVFAKNPSPENAENLDTQFESICTGLQAIRNAISTVAHVALDQDVEAVDATEDENGYKL